MIFFLTWDGETSEISVFSVTEKGILSGSICDLLTGPQKLKASQSLPMNCRGPESEAQSDGLDSRSHI